MAREPKVKLAWLVEHVNTFLRTSENTPEDRSTRQAFIDLVEAALFMEGAYKGFNYIAHGIGNDDKWSVAFEGGATIYNDDKTRRIYYV